MKTVDPNLVQEIQDLTKDLRTLTQPVFILPWLQINPDGTKTGHYLDLYVCAGVTVTYPKWYPVWLIILRSKIPL